MYLALISKGAETIKENKNNHFKINSKVDNNNYGVNGTNNIINTWTKTSISWITSIEFIYKINKYYDQVGRKDLYYLLI